MPSKDEALKMAIETMENTKLGDAAYGLAPSIILDDTINACKEALEQPAQEPVAWLYTKKGDYGYTEDSVEATTSENYAINLSITPVIPLYTHPHQWQGLTDDEISQVYVRSGLYGQRQEWIKAYNEANAKLKEKNYGTDVG